MTYEQYWAIVFGPNRNAADVVFEFDLADGSKADLDEWVARAEVEARLEGADELTEEVCELYHQRALDTLLEASTSD